MREESDPDGLRSAVRIRPADLRGPDGRGVARAVHAYLLQTESEKSREGVEEPAPVAGPTVPRYRREVEDPVAAYAAAQVLVAELDAAIVGMVVVVPQAGFVEIKRLWADPRVRGRGVGSSLLDAALASADGEVRLSVWDWRAEAARLYASRGFRRVPSWEARERLVCMVRPASAA